jgi:hypothetical protein
MIGCDDETTGYDVLVTDASNFNDCMTYCDQTPGCAAWTYDGSCYLKTGTSASGFTFRPSTRNAISGIRARSTGGTSAMASAIVPITVSSQSTPAITSTRLLNNDAEPTSVLSSASPRVPVSGSEPITLSSPVDSVSDPQPTPTSSSMVSVSSFMSEESSTFVPSVITSAQASENTAPSTGDQSVTVTQSSSGDDTSSGFAHGDTTVVNSGAVTSDAVFTGTVIDVEASLSITPHIPLPTSSILWPSVTDIIPSTSVADAASLVTSINIPITIAAPSSSVTCSVSDNLLDICLEATITPSVGAGGVIGVGLGSSTITIIDVSATLGIAPSIAANADLGISIGTSGVGVQASASIGLNPGIADSSRSTATTSVPSTSCVLCWWQCA